MLRRKRPKRKIIAVAPILALFALCGGVLTFGGLPSAAESGIVAGSADGAIVDVALLGGARIASARPSVRMAPSGESSTDDAPSLSVRGADAAAPFGGRVLDTGLAAVSSQGSTAWRTANSAATLNDVE